MSETQDSKLVQEQNTAPPESAMPTADRAEPEQAQMRTPEQEVEEAKRQLAAAQDQLDTAQKRLHEAQKAAGSTIQPLLQKQPEPPVQSPVETQKETTPAETKPEEPAESPKVTGASFGFCNGLFNGLSTIAPITILVILGCMTWPIFVDPTQSVFCPAEIKSLTAFIHSVATNSWFAPVGLDNGSFTLAQWPGFTWLIVLLSLVPGLTDTGWLLPVASLGSTFLAVLGVWALALACRFGRKAAFAASLILLCAPLFAPLPHFMGPAALACGLMLFAMVFFCRGWLTDSAWFSLPLAFILTAFAGLTGGVLHFATPLIASIAFLIWRAKLRRLQAFDAIFGFILMLAILGCWFGWLKVEEADSPYLDLLFAQATQCAWPLPWKWLLPVIAGILGVMPWILMIFGVSWFRVLARSGATLGASRRNNGSAFIWISLVLALIISLFIPAFHPSAVVIASLVALLLGKAFVNLTNGGNRFFFLLAGLCLIVAGIIITALDFEQPRQYILSHLPVTPPVPDLGAMIGTLSVLPWIGAILIIGGLLAFIFVRKYKAAGGLILGIIIVIALCQPARLVLVPELSKMPNTPLVTYNAIKTKVLDALKPAAPKAPEAAAPAAIQAETAPAAQPEQGTAPEAPAPSPETQVEQPASPAEVTPQAEAAPDKAEEVIIVKEPETPK